MCISNPPATSIKIILPHSTTRELMVDTYFYLRLCHFVINDERTTNDCRLFFSEGVKAVSVESRAVL